MTTPEALNAIEKALKAGQSRSIKAQSQIYAEAFAGLKSLRQEKRMGASLVIRALRLRAEGGSPSPETGGDRA